MSRYRYSKWDGTQTGLDLDADDILGELTDDLLYHGDLHAALRRMMQNGFQHDQDHVDGIRDLLDKLRRRRQEELEKHDLGGVYDEIADKLREVVEQEQAALEQMRNDAEQSGDERRAETARQSAAEKQMELGMLPRDLAGKVKGLEHYDFESADAQQRYEELVEELRQQLLQSYFNQMSEALQNVDEEQRARMRDMFDALNRMIEQRERGEEPDPTFEQFMASYGEFFPQNPQTLDELLEQLAQQMAAMQAMLNSMSPEQRAQLQALSNQLLEDMDLRFQMARLGQNLQAAFPGAGWERRFEFRGDQGMGMSEAASVVDRLGDIDDLENLLRSATSPGALADVDIDRARDLLGDDAARSLERMAALARKLEEAGLIEHRDGRTELTPKGMRQIGKKALAELFSKLAKDRLGRHAQDATGVGHERTYETKAYEFGDPFQLSIERTVRNALQRTGGGTPVHLIPDDFEIERTESMVRSSTVLLIDLSLSMPIRDNFLAAKKVAMALQSLMSSQFPRDYLGIVGFSRVAREIKAEELPEVSWDLAYGTNIQHALMLGRSLLAKQSGTKQIIMITDGEPTAHIVPGYDEAFFHYPPVPETIEATLTEVLRCTRDNVRINTFALGADFELRRFVERLTELNRGRAFFVEPENLGDYVLVDFINQRRETAARGQARRRA